MMPREATYYFTRASVPRALDSHILAGMAHEKGLHGDSYATVKEAYDAARAAAAPDDIAV